MTKRAIIFAAVCIAVVAIANSSFAQAVPQIDVSKPGTAFSRGVRGQAIPSINQFRPQATTGTNMSLEIARGSTIRGVAGGLEADLYDWRTRNNDARATTLEYQRFARDFNAELVITANIRGLSELDTSTPAASDRRFYDTSIKTLSKVAADWVRYTNVITQKYRQGSMITDPQDQAILNSLIWTTGPSDTHATLPTSAEAALPKVKYWEIGNEPRVPLASTYQVNNSYTFLAPGRPVDDTHKYDFRERYASITAAMKAVDPTIKVGPAMQWLNAVSEQELLTTILARQGNGQYFPVDFIGYHPYQTVYSTTTPADVEGRLRNIYSTHASRVENIRALITATGRAADSVELIASETNIGSHQSNDTANEASMAHALGTVEEVFSFARIGIKGAHYWLWPGDPWDGTELPVYKAYEGLRDFMGDTLLSDYAENNTRVYTTRDSATNSIAVWGLNFSNTDPTTVPMSIANMTPGGYTAKLWTLKAKTGTTNLFSSNLPSYLPGGPTSQVDWSTVNAPAVNPANFNFTLPASTISVLVFTPIPAQGDYNRNGIVDAADYVLWRNTMGQTGTGLATDGDNSRAIDLNDYNYWRSRFARTAVSGAGASLRIPEPSSALLVLAATAYALARTNFASHSTRRLGW